MPSRPRVHHAGPLLALALTLTMSGCSDLGVKVRLQARAEVSTSAVDFGAVALNDLATRTVTVRNTGNANLVGDATVSCTTFGLTSGGGPFTLVPGGSRDVVLSFSPTMEGRFVCALDLGPDAPQVVLQGIGSLQPPGAVWNVVPATLDFDPIAVGQSSSKSFQIFSTGTAPLTVNVVEGCADYILTSGGGPAIIPPSSSVTVNVSFSPQTGGTHPCTIDVGPGIQGVSVTGAATTVSFAGEIQPIFNSTCVSCHPPNGSLNLNAGSSYGNLVGVPSVGYPTHVRVVPSDPTNSVLYGKIANTGQFGGRMPQGPSQLAQPLIDKVRTWILEGARNN